MNRTDHVAGDSPVEDDLFEPYEEPRRIPLPVYWIAIALALWGTVVLYDNSESVGFAQSERATDLSVRSNAADGSGAALFEARCATCHQVNGAGLRGAVPPLDGTTFVNAQPEVIVQVLLHGIQGPITVGDADYNGNMPNFASVMSDEEIARVATYVRGAWSNRSGPVTADFVRKQRIRTAGLNRSWSGGGEVLAAVGVAGPPQPAPTSADPNSNAIDPALASLVTGGRGDGPWACASCHGLQGQGTLNVPRLAGLNASYIAKQLGDYKGGLRRNETMQTVASSLSMAQMRALGRYYEQLFAPSTAQPSLGGSMALGERLFLAGDWSRNIPSCVSCHGSSGFGVGQQFPALAAQHPAYTAAQLNAWVGGTRNNSPLGLMNGISAKLTDADRRAISDYLATLPPRPRAAYNRSGE